MVCTGNSIEQILTQPIQSEFFARKENVQTSCKTKINRVGDNTKAQIVASDNLFPKTSVESIKNIFFRDP